MMNEEYKRVKTAGLLASGALLTYWWLKPLVEDITSRKKTNRSYRTHKTSPGKLGSEILIHSDLSTNRNEDANSSKLHSQKPTSKPKVPESKTLKSKSKVTPKPLPVRDYGDDVTWLQAFHDFLYPPESDYYWYREGLVGHTDWGPKYKKALFWCLFTGMAGSGSMMGLIIYILHTALFFVHSYFELETIPSEPFWRALVQSPIFCIPVMLCSALFTGAAYYYGASRLENEYTFNPDKKDKEAEWKCQPNRFLSDKLHREEVLWGLVNAFLAGFCGMGLFLWHCNHPFFKLYYDLDKGWLHFFRGFVIVFFWIDLWAYSLHRILHMKSIYKYIHKWHHRYIAPTAFSAFCMHPVEFLSFQTGGIFCCCVFEIHIMAFFGNVIWVAYHGQIDHSGIAFEGDMPWQPSTYYHDDHHQYFHLNFGQNLVLWDWLFGTLRMKRRVYGEDRFEGEQDVIKTTVRVK